MTHHRRRQSIIIFLAAAVAGSILFFAVSNNNNGRREQEASYSAFLRNNINNQINDININDNEFVNGEDDEEITRRRQLSSVNVAKFKDPKSVNKKKGRKVKGGADATSDASQPSSSTGGVELTNEHFTPIDHQSRSNCQIIYILGVEGATHHGFLPIIENLAKSQIDPTTNTPYVVDPEPRALKAGLFGWYYKSRIKKWGFQRTTSMDDPNFVQKVVSESCPPNDGKKHVLIEWASFPSGQQDDKRSYRVRRQHDWLSMTPEEIANTDEALAHPLALNAFYKAYSPYVDIKFVVLHRPFLETIASHHDWDGGAPTHSNIIRGFMLVVRRFLDMHVYDLVTGRKLWNLVCVERIMAKNYENAHDVNVARANVLANLADFLGWPNGECDHCFDTWHESTKDPVKVLGEENVKVMKGHMKWLEGVWPPPGEVGVVEQQCGI